MSEQMVRKYFLRTFLFKLATAILIATFIGIGIVYMILYVPMFINNDYFQVLSGTAIMAIAFVLSAFIVAPFEYRLDKKYGRTTLGSASYLSYKLSNRLMFVIPFMVLLVIYTLFSFATPTDSSLSTPLSFIALAVTVLAIGLIMPRIFGSLLKKEKIEDPELLESIRSLLEKMGIKGKLGVYQVPVKGFKVVNAAQLGFSRRQSRIYLIGDVKQVLDKNELQAVVAHEFAHMKLRHILKLSLLIIGLIGGVYGLFSIMIYLVLDILFIFGVEVTVMILIALVILNYLVPFTVVYLILLKIRRAYEVEADVLAAKSTSAKDLASALNKLAEYNFLPKKYPRGIGVLMSHPPIDARINLLERL